MSAARSSGNCVKQQREKEKQYGLRGSTSPNFGKWIRADDGEARALFALHYPRSLAARRRKTEHEITTGHNVLTHGIWTAFRRR